jgi:hypothetical protein
MLNKVMKWLFGDNEPERIETPLYKQVLLAEIDMTKERINSAFDMFENSTSEVTTDFAINEVAYLTKRLNHLLKLYKEEFENV